MKRIHLPGGWNEIPDLSARYSSRLPFKVICAKKAGIPGYRLFRTNGAVFQDLTENHVENFRFLLEYMKNRHKSSKEILKEILESNKKMDADADKQRNECIDQDIGSMYDYLDKKPKSVVISR